MMRDTSEVVDEDMNDISDSDARELASTWHVSDKCI